MGKDDQTPATKRDIGELERRLKSDILRHFDLTVETIRHDLLGANRDDIETLKDRVGRLEHHTGLVAS